MVYFVLVHVSLFVWPLCYASLCVSRPDDTMLMDLRIILFFYALNYANYASTMFPIIPVLYSYKSTAQLLSMQNSIKLCKDYTK